MQKNCKGSGFFMKLKNIFLTLVAVMMLSFASLASAAMPQGDLNAINASMALINLAKSEIPPSCRSEERRVGKEC